MTRSILLFAVAFALGVLSANFSSAQDRTIRFTKIADTNTLVPPENTETFSRFFEVAIDRGDLSFVATSELGVTGVYAWIDGSLVEIADQTTVLPNSNRLIRDLSDLASIDDGAVTFRANSGAGPEGVYSGSGGDIEVIADFRTLAPPENVRRMGNFGGNATTDDGFTAFPAFTFDSQTIEQGVYKVTPDGEILRVADLSTPIPPDGDLTFGCPTPFCGGPLAFQSVFTSEGNVLFAGLGGSNSRTEDGGLMTHIDGVLERVIPRGATIPGTAIPITSVGLGSNRAGVISGRDIAFVANFSVLIARIDGEFRTIVSSSDNRPGGGGQFERFSSIAMDNANIVFSNRRTITPPDGIFLSLAGTESIIKVITSNDLLDGKEINAFQLGPESIDGHEITFSVFFADGSQGIYIASFGNEAPVADAGADRTAQCTDPEGASVTLDGSASFDAEGDPLTYLWRGPFGEADGVQPIVRLPFGVNVITLTVDDGQLASAEDTVIITVVDTAPPGLVASLTSVGRTDDDDDDEDDGAEGRFQVRFTASDRCDPDAVVSAVLVLPNGAEIPVANGQLIEFERDSETEVEFDDGILEIEAASLLLRAEASDTRGNLAIVEIPLAGSSQDAQGIAAAGID